MDLGATGRFVLAMQGLEKGVSALAALPTPCKLWWRDLAEALWGCRSPPMDSQGVQEVVCAQHTALEMI